MNDAPLLTCPEGRNKLLASYRDGLLADTMKFWFPRSIDTERGGFLHCFDRDGSLLDADKSVWAQGRMSWMLLTLYNTVEPRAEWLAWAKSGMDFLHRHCFDADGRMFFHVTRDGRPIRKRRYAYSESFAAIANAAYAKATGDSVAAARAHALFDWFVDWNFTPGKMPPKFTDTRPLTGMGPRMIAMITAQELRANLGANAKLDGWIDRCIDEIQRLFVKPDLRVVMECVAPDGGIVDHFDGRTLNPGHAIEGAWFILHEGKLRGDAQLIKLGCEMLDWMWERGWDKECGGIFYFRDVFGKPVQEYWHDMKFWWPHDETIIATLLAYELTGDEKYARWHQQVHDWAHRHFGDAQHGEWFGYLHRDGRVSVPLKGNLWKSFFHHPRMQWYCWRALQKPAGRFGRAQQAL
jgi:N-acylglucosamine 2-epimerase